MRYWIYWNELVQGPFEVGELVSLHAFRADLLICEEGRDDWTPAVAISELAEHFQVVNAAPPAAPPPPPPPQPPSLFPLQGEFFSESPAQQPLFDLNGSKHYAFRPVQDQTATVPDDQPPPVTAPFRFAVILPPWIEAPVKLKPPKIKEPPSLKETESRRDGETETQDVSQVPPVTDTPTLSKEIQPAWMEEPLTVVPDDLIETPPTPLESARPSIEERPLPVKDISPQPPVEQMPITPEKPVELPMPIEPPAPVKAEPFVRKTLPPRLIRELPSIDLSTTEITPAVELDEPRLWPWMIGAFACLALIGWVLITWMKHSPGSYTPVAETPPPVTAPEPIIPPPLARLAEGGPPASPAPTLAPAAPAPANISGSPGNGRTPSHAKTSTFPHPDIESNIPAAKSISQKAATKKVSLKAATPTSPQPLSGSIVVSAWHTLGEAGHDAGRFSSPAGVSVGVPNLVWVADQANNRVQSYDPATGQWTPLGKAGDGAGEFHAPSSVAVDTQGRIWVADQGNNRVQVYDPIKQAWSVVGKPGIAAGQFRSPSGVTVDAQQQIWVTDQGNNRVQEYDPVTQTWTVIGKAGQGTGQFKVPSSVVGDAKQRIWVSDQGNHRLQVYVPATKKWFVLGKSGTSAGELNSPASVAVDAQQRIWVTDQGNNRVQVYDPAKKQWAIVGKPGNATGEFNAPSGIAVDSQQRVWIADQGNHRLQMTQILSAGLPIAVKALAPVSPTAASAASAARNAATTNAERGSMNAEGGNSIKKNKLPSSALPTPNFTAGESASAQASLPAKQLTSLADLNSTSAKKVSASAAGAGESKKQSNGESANKMNAVAPVPTLADSQIQPSAPIPPISVTPTPPLTNTPIPALPATSLQPVADPWRGKEQQAIAMTLQQKIYTGHRTVASNANLMLEDMHEKELLHAGDTGERLYLPDKIAWTALHEEGPHYRVYLNFMAWQANGERIQARSDQFEVDLQKKTVGPEDESTRHDFYDLASMLHHQHSPKADDIESVLSSVDVVNRQKVRAVILKGDKKNKDEQKNIQNALQVAEGKFQRMIVYFRTKYAEHTLQNIGKAYMFSGLLKGR